MNLRREVCIVQKAGGCAISVEQVC